jgi:hypothetical protein
MIQALGGTLLITVVVILVIGLTAKLTLGK